MGLPEVMLSLFRFPRIHEDYGSMLPPRLSLWKPSSKVWDLVRRGRLPQIK